MAIFTRKHLCWSLFLIKLQGWRPLHFIEKETPTQVFFCEYCEIIENSFFIEHLLPIILFRNFYVMMEFFGCLWVQNWYFSHSLCHCFVFFRNSSVSVAFILKFLVSITFARITLLESETASSVLATSPSNLLWKMWIWVSWILCFAIIFL